MTGADSVSPPRGHFVVATFGTLGDFLPAFGIARELAAAGHRVDMVAPRYFAPTPTPRASASWGTATRRPTPATWPTPAPSIPSWTGWPSSAARDP